ncbi:MAG: Ras GTPase [Chaenotheca gracillima]|nr:MAG: Ras GTPase [Chaenotheca gracillima]
MKSNYELVADCDNFPCPVSDATAHYSYFTGPEPYWTLFDCPDGVDIGFVHPSVSVALLEFQKNRPYDASAIFTLDEQHHAIYFKGTTPETRSAAVAKITQHWREAGKFAVLAGWRNELYPVYGPDRQRLFDIERSASALFGVVTYGVHMMAYVRSPTSDQAGGSKEEIRLWVPRRAATKQTYPSMLDNTVAGGLASGEDAFEAIVREASEEASLPSDLVRKRAKAAGAVSYFHLRDERAGGESGLCQPEVQYIYDLDLTAEEGQQGAEGQSSDRGAVVPKPSDDEVQEFYLWDVEQVKAALGRGEFKPNCALVLVDFFVRHGLISRETEGPGFMDMISKMHRKLDFPTA